MKIVAELFLQEVVQIEPSEKDEKRDKTGEAEAAARRWTTWMSFARVAAVRPSRDLDGPRRGHTAAPEPPWTPPLFSGHSEHWWT